MRCNLAVKWTSGLETKTLASFEVDGGNEFHEAFVELPLGTFNIIFEYSYRKGVDYRISIDDVQVDPHTCSDASECAS